MSDRERWRNIRRAPGYRVSSLGRVRSPGGVLSPVADRDGYLRVTLAGEDVRVTHLVLEAFVSPRPFGSEACHDPMRSEGRSDCRLLVLRWDSHRSNLRDKLRDAGGLNGRWISHPEVAVTPVTSDVLR